MNCHIKFLKLFRVKSNCKGDIKMKGTKFLQAVAVSFGLIILGGYYQSSYAVAKLSLSDGSKTIEVSDGDSNDARGESGIVSFQESFGEFSYLDLAVTGSVYGSASYPQMDLSASILGSSGSGTLTIWFSETGFGPTSGYFKTEVSGITDGSTSFNSYLDQANSLYGTSTTLASIGSISGSVNSGNYALSNPYSLSTKATVTHGDGMNATSFGMNVVAAPEPVSSALFLIGGAFMGARHYIRRKNKVNHS